MAILNTPGAIKKFKRTQWRFQQTVRTPLNDLETFVSTILTPDPSAGGTITIDQIVFEPRQLKGFLRSASADLGHDCSIEATDQEVTGLLVACFSDWMDFLFVPVPKTFAIYADHDEYATFFATSKSNLNKLIVPLRAAGYSLVSDWKREF